MSYKLLISGDREEFTTLALDADAKKLSIIANYQAPYNVSWVERSSSCGDVDRLIGFSEGLEKGFIFTFDMDHSKSTFNYTSQQPCLGAPAHCKELPFPVVEIFLALLTP